MKFIFFVILGYFLFYLTRMGKAKAITAFLCRLYKQELQFFSFSFRLTKNIDFLKDYTMHMFSLSYKEKIWLVAKNHYITNMNKDK